MRKLIKQERKKEKLSANLQQTKNIKSKVGKYFVSLLYKYFQPHHKFHRMFNQRKVKISYSGMPT